MKKLILASTSPRRKELLSKTGIPFEVVASAYEEDMTLPLEPLELARHLSKGKAETVAVQHPGTVILGADTFIAFDGEVLGKPYTAEKARETLLRLSGKSHSIITGFTVVDTDSGRISSKAIETKVYFRDLSESEIRDYIATEEPLDRAGAYAIQGGGGKFVERIEGDYDNAVGLPVTAVVEELREFGISK